MKLIEVTYNHLNQVDGQRMGRFAPGINFIYGERGAGKTRFCGFLRGLLCGQHLSQNLDSPALSMPAAGRLRLSDGNRELLLTRTLAKSSGLVNPSGLEIQDHLGVAIPSPGWCPTLNFLAHVNPVFPPSAPFQSEVNRELFDLIYSFNCGQTGERLPRLRSMIQANFKVPLGESASGGDERAYQGWKLEVDRRTQRLSELSQLIDQLRHKRQQLLEQLEAELQTGRLRMLQIERELQSFRSLLSGDDLQLRRARLVELENQMTLIKEEVSNVLLRESHQSSMCRIPEHAELQTIWYTRLDELDFQIRNWRTMQSALQTRRVQLKQEMQDWNEMTLQSPSHPYHSAQKLLTSIESRVNHTDQQARHWELTPAQQTDPTPAVRNIQTLCQSMRDDLHHLGQELGSQYKHIRHRAAAIELKHLRESFEMASQNLNRLLRVREQVVAQLERVDAAGAAAILKGERGFLELAEQHGYLEARRRKLGAWPLLEREVPASDLAHFRQRLALLDNDRNLITRGIADFEAKRADVEQQQRGLLEEQQRLQQKLEQSSSAELNPIDVQLNKLMSEQELLQRQARESREFSPPTTHLLLKRANQLLQIGSQGEFLRVWLAAETVQDSFLVADSGGSVIPVAKLQSFQQDLVYVSLAAAAKESLRESGLELPSLIDDAFLNFSRDNVRCMILLLEELQRSGHQIFLFTNHQYLADRLPGAPVFELPVPAIVPQMPLPETDIFRRESSSTHSTRVSPVIDLGAFATPPGVTPSVFVSRPISADDWMAEIEMATGARQAESSTRNSYPLSKYPPVIEPQDNRDFIVAYPGANEDFSRQRGGETDRRLGSLGRQRRSESSAPQTTTPVPVETIADPLGFAPTVDELTALDSLEIFNLDDLRKLAELEIDTVQQLLAVSPEELSLEIRSLGITADQMDRWQSIVWLLCNVPGMHPEDARILTACGVTEPEHLATSQSQQLLERLERYLSLNKGARVPHQQAARISIAKINSWLKALQSTRSRWQRTGELSRLRQRSVSARAHRNSPRDSHSKTRMEPRSPLATDPSRSPRTPIEIRPPRMQTPDRASRTSRLNLDERTRDRSQQRESNKESEKNRFYLDLKDHIEAAPSIGPKTAERFERIGISTVADFLKQTAESMATKLKYRRITADVIRAWQDQTRLVCQIPNLRGHDAQLLVACDFTEPDKIAAMHPQKLLDIVLPFSRTKEGLKIIRTGKEPDLQEITDWIRWAAMNRSLHAA